MMFEAKVIERFSVNGAEGAVIESVPEDIKDLQELKGMHVLINGEEYEITAVNNMNSNPRQTDGPQGILIKKIEENGES